MLRLGWSLVLSFLITLVVATPAAAYICPQVLNPREHFHGADVVLIGQVESAQKQIALSVERTYKGAVGERVEVVDLLGLYPLRPQPGDRLLLFLHRTGDGELVIGPCQPQTHLELGEGLPPYLAFVVLGLRGIWYVIPAAVAVLLFVVWRRRFLR